MTAIVLLAIVVVTAVTWGNPAPVNAQTLLKQAPVAEKTPRVHSYHLTATVTINNGRGGPWKDVLADYNRNRHYGASCIVTNLFVGMMV
ncbi:MAG TPA: hypothetical protein VFD70_00345 [Anaerolineae bacterium]|nr:hypothetical protein [Anaerolineae bacterium]